MKQLREELEATKLDRERVYEGLSNAVLMLRQEDIGWARGAQGSNYKGLDIKAMQKWANDIRASLSGSEDGLKAPNPHMRQGLMLRHSFIWQGDIHYDKLPAAQRGKKNVNDLIEKVNHRQVFSAPARRRREAALYSDGFYLLIGENRTKKLTPAPLSQITDVQFDEFDENEIVAFRWTRNVATRLKPRGKQAQGTLSGERHEESVWVYTDWFDGEKPGVVLYNGQREKVLKTHTAFDFHANRPDGQAWGSPDAIAAVVWARVIRDLIMNGVKMQDALAMFAFKATSGSKAGQQQAALELGDKDNTAGSAAVLGAIDELVPLNTAGKGYDFGSIGFVVSTMAASLHLSGIALSANTALAGSSYGAAKTLDLPGRMAMETRRAEHIEYDERLLKWFGADDAVAYFNSYDDSTDEYRAVQAAMLMWQSGNLTPEGFRAELETIYGRGLVGRIPAGVIIPNNAKEAEKAAKLATDQAVATAEATAATTPAPDQGQSKGTGGSGHAADIPAKK